MWRIYGGYMSLWSKVINNDNSYYYYIYHIWHIYIQIVCTINKNDKYAQMHSKHTYNYVSIIT